MFLQPTAEEAYFDDDDDDDNGGPSYAQNEPQKAPGSPDTFFFVQTHPSPSLPQAQMQSPAQAYAQSYVQTLNHSHDNGERPPLASDSSQTPPSPIPKQRRSIQRPSLSNHNSSKRTSNAHNSTADANVKDSKNANNTSANGKRTQSLNALPQKTLIHLLQIKEEERKRAKNLLRSALAQLEVEVERGDILGIRVRELEERVERVQSEEGGMLGVDALKEMLAEQKGRVSGGAEVEGLKLKLSNTETELRRVKEDYRALKIERDDSDRALVRARALAREMKEKAILIQAREQGRQEGFEEGLKQGRLLGEGATGEASGTRSRRSREQSTNHSSRRNPNPVTADVGPSQASLEAEAAIRSIAERENERVRLQLKDVERELDMERQKVKDVEREKRLLEKTTREEREKRDEREREKERARDRERAKERERDKEREAGQRDKERDMREALKKQVDERVRLQRAKERLELEKDKVREQMEKEKQDVEKKLAEAHKDKEKFEKLLKEEKEKAVPLPYLAMAPPPRPSSSGNRVPEVSRTSSTESHRHQRSSIDSQASTIHFDMLQSPDGERGSGLSVIHEDVSAGRASPSVNSASGSAPPPTWFTNPPIDYSKNDGDINRGSTPNGSYQHHQNQPDYLTPPDNEAQSLRRSTGSTGSYEFVIVPPSRPPSVVGGGDPESNNSHNAHNTHQPNTEDPQFLSPNHRPIQLPQTQTRAESPAARPIPSRYTTPGDTSGIPTQPNSPVGLMGTVDVNGGGFPFGFVPQSITDARGRSTPIGGSGFIPPFSPSGGGGLERSGTPAPIYGNPIALERDKKREEAETAATPPRSQSPVGEADWSAPLAALHPPIFPITGHQQPFQHPPPGAGGTWGGGGSSNDRIRNEHSPILSTRPFIPGQTSTVGNGEGTTPNHHPGSFGGGVMTPRNQDFSSPVIPTQPLAGGGAWGAPNRPPSGFGTGAGSTPGPRSQNLPPVIPNPTVGGGGWSTPSRPPSGFGGGSTPGPRNQDLPPVIPNPTVGGGGWSTPSRPPSGFGGGGMTPGPRNQDLPSVIPNSTLGGGWSTPNRPPSGFGGGGGMTPGHRNQDLPPVIPNSTVGGGWSTPGHATGSFGAGAGSTPGPRSQDLPPVIPNSTMGGGWTPNRPPVSFGGGGMTPGPRNQDLPPIIPNATVGGGRSTPGHAAGSFGGGTGSTPGPRSQDLPPVIPNSTMGGWTPNRPPVSFGGGGMTPGPRNQDLPPVIPNATVGGGWSTPGHAAGIGGGTGSTPGPRSQDLPPVIPNPTLGGDWSMPNPPGSFGAGGMTPGPRSQDLPPVIPNPTLGSGWNTPSRAAGGFGAGSTPGPINQDLPSVGGGGNGSPFQPNFSIYGPPTNGAHSSSPYPNGEGVGEDGDEDPITAQNTKMNATLGMDVGPSTGTGGGGRGGKTGKKGKKKR